MRILDKQTREEIDIESWDGQRDIEPIEMTEQQAIIYGAAISFILTGDLTAKLIIKTIMGYGEDNKTPSIQYNKEIGLICIISKYDIPLYVLSEILGLDSMETENTSCQYSVRKMITGWTYMNIVGGNTRARLIHLPDGNVDLTGYIERGRKTSYLYLKGRGA